MWPRRPSLISSGHGSVVARDVASGAANRQDGET
jgi:hypothetical protein